MLRGRASGQSGHVQDAATASRLHGIVAVLPAQRLLWLFAWHPPTTGRDTEPLCDAAALDGSMTAFLTSVVPGPSVGWGAAVPVCCKPSSQVLSSFAGRRTLGGIGTSPPLPFATTHCHPVGPSVGGLASGHHVVAAAETPAGVAGQGVPSTGVARLGDELNPAEKEACASSTSFVDVIGVVGPVRRADSDPVFESSLATSPGKPPVVVDCTSEVRALYNALRRVSNWSPLQQSADIELGLVTSPTSVTKQQYKDPRYGALGLVAGAGSGKTYLLEQVASRVGDASVFQADETAMVEFCRGLRPYIVNFNLHWKLRSIEAALVVDKNVIFSIDSVVDARLLFMHYADLSASHIQSHFTRFVKGIDQTVRSGHLSAQELEEEAVALLQTDFFADGGKLLPVVLVDEVGKMDNMKEKACRTLQAFILANKEVYTDNDQLHSPATLALSAACNAVQRAGGNVITTFMSSSLLAKCETLSGRRITPVGGLFGRDALAFRELFVDVLVRVASNDKFYMAMDGARSGSSCVLKAIIAARAKLERSNSYEVKLAAYQEMKAAMIPIANGMCFIAGGHTRTVVVFHDELYYAGMARQSTSLATLIKSASSNLLLSEALDCWVAASDDDRDNLLAALTLGEQVSRRDVCFPERRHPHTGEILTKELLYDGARLKGLVIGDGEQFQPTVPPVALYLYMERSTGSRFYPIMRSELGLDKELPGAFDMTREVPCMRWEDFFMRHQAAMSVARSMRKERFKAVSLAKVLAARGAIHVGAGPLLHDVLVDASTPRTQVLHRDLLAILSARGRGVGQERAKTIYQLPYGTAGADAVMFFRKAGPNGEWIMVLLQFRHSKDDASTNVCPAHVVADWEKFPKEHMMGRKLFKTWKNRMVYLNASKREHVGFPSALQSKDKDVADLSSQHSVVLSLSNMEAALGPTFCNYINAMDWIHCATLQPF